MFAALSAVKSDIIQGKMLAIEGELELCVWLIILRVNVTLIHVCYFRTVRVQFTVH